MSINPRYSLVAFAAVVSALLIYGALAHSATASPDGTAIIASGTPPALNASFGALVDNTGNTWSVVGGVISENAKPLVATHGVFELLLCKGVIWQEANAKNNWWSWSGTAWSAESTIDPTPTCPLAVVPPPGPTVTINGSVKVVCPVTPAALIGAINSNMNCAVSITGLSMTSP
jgi:hypothetical protein